MGQRDRVFLVGQGAHLPPFEYTNRELAPYFNCNENTADKYGAATGVETRRSVVDLVDGRRQKMRNETLASEAARVALENAGIEPNDVDHVFTASSMFDYLLPSTSQRVLKLLGIAQAATFDTYGGCAQFMVSVHLASNLIRNGQAQTVVVTGSEVITSFARQFRYPSDAFIFGDAGGAWVLTNQPVESSQPVFELHETEMATLSEFDGDPTEVIIQPITGWKEPFDLFHYDDRVDERMAGLSDDDRPEYRWTHNTKLARKLATFGMREGFDRVRKNSQVDHGVVVPHQGTKPVLKATAEEMPDGWTIIDNLAHRGNLSTACVPVAMYEHLDEVAAAPEVVCTTVGVGFTYAAARLTPYGN